MVRRHASAGDAGRVRHRRAGRQRPRPRAEHARAEGKVLRIACLARAAANPVTGRSGIDAVERYFFFHRGRDAIVTLSGPKGADNVDPWRLVTNSLRWAR